MICLACSPISDSSEQKNPPPPPPASQNPITTCQADADCSVKNIGNCCGYYPACVNNDSPTDPESVMKHCQESGMISDCGFQEIQSCQCLEGQCQPSGTELSPGANGLLYSDPVF